MPDNVWEDDGSRTDHYSRTGRPQLELALTQAMRDDTFIVARLEAVFTPNKVFRWTIEELQRRRIHFCALDVGIDTHALPGNLGFVALLKHLDSKREFRSVTTLAGLAKANSQGRFGGRRPVLSPEKRAQVVALIEAGELPMREIANRLGVSRSSLYNAKLSARPQK